MEILAKYEMVSIHVRVPGLVTSKAENLRKLRGATLLASNSPY